MIEVQEIPSEEVSIVPEPTATKMLLPKVISNSGRVVPEVLLSQEVPSGEVRMVPDSPTVTNNPVVVELSVFVVLDELLDEVQDMEMKLKRNRERMMSRCFNWFPKLVGFIRRTLYIPQFGGVLQESGDFTW